MANSDKDFSLDLKFKIKGGSDVNGETYLYIKNTLTKIMENMVLPIRFDKDSLKVQFQEALDSVSKSIKPVSIKYTFDNDGEPTVKPPKPTKKTNPENNSSNASTSDNSNHQSISSTKSPRNATPNTFQRELEKKNAFEDDSKNKAIATNIDLIRKSVETIKNNGVKVIGGISLNQDQASALNVNTPDTDKKSKVVSVSIHGNSAKSLAEKIGSEVAKALGSKTFTINAQNVNVEPNAKDNNPSESNNFSIGSLKKDIVDALKSSFSELVTVYRDSVQTITKLVASGIKNTDDSKNKVPQNKQSDNKIKTPETTKQSSNVSDEHKLLESIIKSSSDAISKNITQKIIDPLSDAAKKIKDGQEKLNQSICSISDNISSLDENNNALRQLINTAQELSNTSLTVLNATVENASKIRDTFTDIKLEATLSEGDIKNLLSEMSKNNSVSEAHLPDDSVKKSRYDPGKYALSKQAYQEYVSAMKESFSLLRESLNYSPDSQAYNALVKASESKSFLANGILGRISREGLKDNRLYEKAKREIDVIRAKYETEQEQVGDNRTLNIGDMASSVGESNNLLGAISQCLEEIKTQISSKDFIVSVSKEDIKGMVSELAKERSAQAEKKQKEKVQKTAVVQTNAKQNKITDRNNREALLSKLRSAASEYYDVLPRLEEIRKRQEELLNSISAGSVDDIGKARGELQSLSDEYNQLIDKENKFIDAKSNAELATKVGTNDRLIADDRINGSYKSIKSEALYDNYEKIIKELYEASIKLVETSDEVGSESYQALADRVSELTAQYHEAYRLIGRNEAFNRDRQSHADDYESQYKEQLGTATKRRNLANDLDNWSQKNLRALTEFRGQVEEIRSLIGTSDKEQLDALRDDFDRIKAAAQSQGLTGRNPTQTEINANIAAAQALQQKLQDLMKSAGAGAYAGDMQTKVEEVTKAINKAISDGMPDSLKAARSQLSSLTSEFKSAGIAGANMFTAISKKVKGLFTLIVGGTVISGMRNALQDAARSVIQLDTAFTNISMTMPITSSNMRELKDSSISLARELGVSLDQVMTAAEIYANKNISVQEIIARSTPTALLSSASGMTTGATADLIQGSLYQFNMEDSAENLMRIVDVVESVSASTGVEFRRSIEQISEAIQTSGAIAAESGYSLEQYSATVGALVEKTRKSGSEVANALKMIFARMGQNREGEATEEEISKVEKAYRSMGIEIRDGTDSFRDIPDVLADLSEKWATMTDTERAYIAEVSAGNRNRSVFVSLMDSYATQLSLTETALNSEGFALEANEKKLESYDAKLGQFTAAAQGFYNNFLDTKIIKDILTVGTETIEFLDTVGNKLGVLKPLLTYFGVMALPNIWVELKNSEGMLGAVARVFSSTIGQVRSAIRQNTVEIEANSAATAENAAVTAASSAANASNATSDLVDASATATSMAAENAATASTIANINATNASTNANNANAASQLRLAGALKGLGAAMLSNPLGWIAAALSVVTIIAQVTQSIKQAEEDRIQELEDAKKASASFVKQVKSERAELVQKSKKMDELLEQYEKLSKGVNDNGKNVSLTTKEYEKYRSVVGEIADMNPDLVKGYNSQGDALLDLGGKIDSVKEKYIEMQKEAAAASLSEYKDEVLMSNFATFGDGGSRNVTTDKEYYDELVSVIETLKEFRETWDSTNLDGVAYNIRNRDEAAFQKLYDNQGIIQFENLKENPDELNSIINAMDRKISELNSSLRNSSLSMTELLTEMARASDEYYKLSESGKDFLSQTLNNIASDGGMLLARIGSDENEADKFLSEVLMLAQNPKILDLYDKRNKLEGKFKNGTIPAEKYFDEIENIRSEIEEILYNSDFKTVVSVGFDMNEYNQDIKFLIDDIYSRVIGKIRQSTSDSYLGQYETNTVPVELPDPSREVKDYLSSLDISALRVMSSLPLGKVFSIQQLDKMYKEELDRQEREAKAKFKLESVKTEVEDYKKAVKELAGYKEKITSMTSDEITELMLAHPDFDWKRFGVTGEQGVGRVGEAIDELIRKEYQDLIDAAPYMSDAQKKAFEDMADAAMSPTTAINTFKSNMDDIKNAIIKADVMISTEILGLMQKFAWFDWARWGVDGVKGSGDFKAALQDLANQMLRITSETLGVGDTENYTILNQITEDTKNAVEGLENVSDLISKIKSTKDAVKSVNEDLMKYGVITSDTISDIINAYPELEAAAIDYFNGSISEQDFLNKVKDATSKQLEDYKQYLKYKIQTNSEFYKLTVKLNDDTISEIEDSYGVDLHNCETYLDAKSKLYEEFKAKTELFDYYTNKYISEDGTFDLSGFMQKNEDIWIANILSSYAEASSKIDKIFDLAIDRIFDGIGRNDKDILDKESELLKDMLSLYDEILDAIQIVSDKKIEALDEEIDKLEKRNSEEKKEIELIKLRKQLDDARNNKTIREYREGQGFVWAADQKAIAEAEEALKDAEVDAKKQALENEKEALEKYKKQFADIPSDIEDAKKVGTALDALKLERASDLLSLTEETRKALSSDYEKLYIASDKQDNAEKIAQYTVLNPEQLDKLLGHNFIATSQNLVNSLSDKTYLTDTFKEFASAQTNIANALSSLADTNAKKEDKAETPIYIENFNVTYSGNDLNSFLNDVRRYTATKE